MEHIRLSYKQNFPRLPPYQ